MKDWYLHFHDSLWLRPPEGGDDDARFIKKALRLRKGQSVLDAPCGAGRITLPLAKLGLNASGVDLRKKFIDRAKRRFRRARLSWSPRVMDLREIEFEDEFHGICNWYGSFGYFTNREHQDLVLRYAKALRPGGRLLIDQTNRQRILRSFLPETYDKNLRRDGAIMNLRTQSKWNPRTQRVEAIWTIEKGAERIENPLLHRLYTQRQMAQLFENAGLEVGTVYGSPRGEPYARSSWRMITVGVKPKP
jgi:SAM-dependent methyltransferase